MKRAVVTGASGFIGTHLLKELLRRGFDVCAVVRPGSAVDPSAADGLSGSGNLQTVALNMEQYGRLAGEIGQADVFYHLAWAGVRKPFRDDAAVQEANFRGAAEAMRQARLMGCSFFLGAGSQAEYGSCRGKTYEDCACSPVTEYGRQKLAACRKLGGMAEEAEMRFIWARIFSLYGPGDFSGTLIMNCLKKMQKNESIDLTECSQLWDFLYVKDAAAAMAEFAGASCGSGIYNLAGGDVRPLKDYITELKEILHSTSVLNFGAVPYGEGGRAELNPAAEKTAAALGWKAATRFCDGVADMLSDLAGRGTL